MQPQNSEHYQAYKKLCNTFASKINIGNKILLDWEDDDFVPPYSYFENTSIQEMEEITTNINRSQPKNFDNVTEAIIDTTISVALSTIPYAGRILALLYAPLKGLHKDIFNKNKTNNTMPPNNNDVQSLEAQIRRWEQEIDALKKVIQFFTTFLADLTANINTLGKSLNSQYEALPTNTVTFINTEVKSNVQKQEQIMQKLVNEVTIPKLKGDIVAITKQIEIARERIKTLQR